MNIRRVQTMVRGDRIFVRMDIGHASEAVSHQFEIDPATALVLSSQLEAAVHRTQTSGLELFDTETGLEDEKEEIVPAAIVAAAAAKPISVAQDDLPIS